MNGNAFRTLLAAATLGVVALATAQIVVPASSVRKPASSRQAHTNYLIFRGARVWSHARGVARASVAGYYPSDIRAAYGLPSTGGSEAIAIIDAYDLPTNLHDFNVFSSQFGLPQESSSNATASSNKVLQVVYAAGSQPSTGPKSDDFPGEIALDMEWAHAIAPNAKIYLIECASNDVNDLQVGIQKAAQLTDVREVSMSFGASEYSAETGLDSTFTAGNQVYFAAAGDTSNELDYPAASPNVIGVGGTSLNVANGAFVSESAWNESGGGPSAYESIPAYQSSISVVTATGHRCTPDIAADGDPNTGVAVYDSTPLSDGTRGWAVFGGTSLSTPVCAAITNLRGNFATSSYGELLRQYGLAGTSRFRDITTGSSGAYEATSGYDLITGLGSLTYTFPTTAYAPSALSLATGTRVSGIPGNVVALDNHDLIVRSVSSGSAQAAVLSGSFATSLSSGATRLGATLSVTGMNTGSSLTLSLYNVATGAYDVVSTSNFGTTNGTISIPVSSYANYFDSSGNVGFMISAGGTGVFRLGMDQIQLGVSSTY